MSSKIIQGKGMINASAVVAGPHFSRDLICVHYRIWRLPPKNWDNYPKSSRIMFLLPPFSCSFLLSSLRHCHADLLGPAHGLHLAEHEDLSLCSGPMAGQKPTPRGHGVIVWDCNLLLEFYSLTSCIKISCVGSPPSVLPCPATPGPSSKKPEVCGNVLADVGLFSLALVFLILMFATAISPLGDQKRWQVQATEFHHTNLDLYSII